MGLVAKAKLSGRVVADTIEVRYPWSGKVARVNKRSGDKVKKGELLVSLDRTLLQKELERQLADYDKTRANFEIFAKHHPNPGDDLTIYAKRIEQAELNISVKDVEIAKAKLDQADLVSPVNGIVVDDGGNRTGMYVTPASNVLKVLDQDSVRVVIEDELDRHEFWSLEREALVKIGVKEINGRSKLPIPDGKKLIVEVGLSDNSQLIPGLEAEVEVKE